MISEDQQRKETIKFLYKTILKREADESGLNHYVQSKFDVVEIANIFVNSDEYKQSVNSNSNEVDNLKSIFSSIYQTDFWSGGSGPGSHPTAVTDYILVLTETIKKYNVKSVLDYGCGDWQFSKLIDWDNLIDSYTGADVVDSLIQHHNQEYSTDKIKFENIDNDWQFPQVDLIICKDVLQHLPTAIVTKLLSSFKKSAKFVLLTNDIAEVNQDCVIGDWRGIDLSKDPWNENVEELLSWEAHIKGRVKRTVLIKN